MKRTSLLCVIAVALMAALVLPAFAAVEVYQVSVANPGGDPIPKAPAFVNYMLNSQAAVTVEILPSDINGNITGAAVRTEPLGTQARGKHVYLWPCTNDAGTMVTPGYYVTRLTAQATPSQWDVIAGLYLNDDPDTEYPARPSLPAASEGTGGFYGVGVNRNPNSPYYGRIYAPHQSQQDVYMYDSDGSYIGKMNDTGVAWGGSAPWDICVADDGYVYIADRSNMFVYCFSPDGQYVSVSGTTTNHRALFARVDGTGVTHVYSCSGDYMYENTLSANHLTWSGRTQIYRPGGAADVAWGFWVSPDLSTIYQTCTSGPNNGVSKWTGQTGGTYTKAATWTTVPSPKDVDISSDGTYLWVTSYRGYSSTTNCIFKMSIAPGTEGTILGQYDVISWGHMLATDAIGNVVISFGKSSATWPAKYWGTFAEPVTNTVTKVTTSFQVTDDPAPVIVPGSESWVFSDPSGKLVPDDTATATVTFKVLDANGYSDIGAVTVDVRSLRSASEPNPVQPVDSLVPDTGDPNGLTGICTKTMKAVSGTKYGIHDDINVTAYDVHPVGNPNSTNALFSVDVTGSTLSGSVLHLRYPAAIAGATIVAQGGNPNAYGYPFTYRSPATDGIGAASFGLGAGTYQVWAEKLGYKSQTASTEVVPNLSTIDAGTIYLGPLTMADAKTLPSGTLVSIEGVCVGEPLGVAPTAFYGLDHRVDTVDASSNPIRRHQWYMVDPNNPSSGLLFMQRLTDTTFVYTWDDPNAQDDFGNSLYIGKRPAAGETICVTGAVETRPGYETRVFLTDANFAIKPFNETFLNRGNVGGMPSAPVVVTVPDISHPTNTSTWPAWGKYVELQNVTPVLWKPDGKFFDGTSPADPTPYLVVTNSQGNWTTVTFDTQTSLNIPGNPPVTMGATYTIKGIAGRRCRYGEGTIRVRSAADIIKTGDRTVPPADSVNTIRGSAGGPVDIRGIVTGKFTNYMYIESSNRAVGVKVTTAPWFVNVGDDVQVTGNLMLLDGQKQIAPTADVVVRGTGNSIAAFDMRTRDVGGAAFGPNDPGVTGGRGALNVGLLVHVAGMVTYRDTATTPAFFYIWDGANSVETPVNDGTGYKGIRINHSGWLGTAAVPWTDWVDMTGIVSVNTTAVPGSAIPEIIPIATPTKVTAFDTITAPAGTALTANWSLIGLPSAPAGTGDGDEFSPKPWEPYVCFGPNHIPDDVDGRIIRRESVNQSLYTYDMWSEPQGPFGGMLLGDGYWFKLPAAWAVSYQGKNSALDQWISIAQPGWLLMGHPKGHNTYWADCKVHNGGDVKTLMDASQWTTASWLNSIGLWWDNQSQGLSDIGLPDDWPITDTLTPWHGYWVRVFQGDKALIVPDQPVAP